MLEIVGVSEKNFTAKAVIEGIFECRMVSAIRFNVIFEYRHQFRFFTLNYAKLLSSMYLGVSEITLNYAYLS